MALFKTEWVRCHIQVWSVQYDLKFCYLLKASSGRKFLPVFNILYHKSNIPTREKSIKNKNKYTYWHEKSYYIHIICGRLSPRARSLLSFLYPSASVLLSLCWRSAGIQSLLAFCWNTIRNLRQRHMDKLPYPLGFKKSQKTICPLNGVMSSKDGTQSFKRCGLIYGSKASPMASYPRRRVPRRSPRKRRTSCLNGIVSISRWIIDLWDLINHIPSFIISGSPFSRGRTGSSLPAFAGTCFARACPRESGGWRRFGRIFRTP